MELYHRTPNTTCKICQAPIYRRPKQIANGDVFCSHLCTSKHQTILINCIVCGISYRKGLNKITCSKSCSNKTRIGMVYKSPGAPIKDKVKTNRSLKKRLIETRGTKCENCGYGVTELLHVHHIIRKADGGSNELDNLKLICANCHTEEHHKNKLKILN